VSARIGCGGVAATPKRATATEQALAGRAWTRETAEHAAQALEREFTPIDDMRASAAYRRRALANLLRRLWLETGGVNDAPTRVEHVQAAD
jgi:xanthine dehydrogenase small subunit